MINPYHDIDRSNFPTFDSTGLLVEHIEELQKWALNRDLLHYSLITSLFGLLCVQEDFDNFFDEVVKSPDNFEDIFETFMYRVMEERSYEAMNKGGGFAKLFGNKKP